MKIIDRKKGLIVTAVEKTVAPQNLENLLKKSPCISNAMVYGDRRKYLVALLRLDQENIASYAREKQLYDIDPENIHHLPMTKNLISDEIERCNQDLARFETIKRFAILPEDLSLEQGELTPTRKRKRKNIISRYSNVIEDHYSQA